MALNQDIQILLGGLKTQVPAPMFGQLQAMFDRLETAGTGKLAPKPGDNAPEVKFELPDGNETTLAELYAPGTLVLLFYRGRWCPFCDLTLRAYDKQTPSFQAAGARLIAVSPQTLEETEKTREERSLTYDVLRDPHNAAAHAFGLDWELTDEEQQLYAAFNSHVDQANGDPEWRLPAPAVFVIDQSGTVRWSWADSNWTHRAEPADVLVAVQEIAQVDPTITTTESGCS